LNKKGKDGTNEASAGGKVEVDDRGRSVWVDPIDSGEFDLVSTQELRQILNSDDVDGKRAIEKVAASEADGVVVRNSATGMFRVVNENELQAMLANDRARQDRPPPDVGLEPLPRQSGDGDELSLLSTQALRKIVKPGAPEAEKDEHKIGGELDDLPIQGGGFNPYDSG